MDHLHGRQEEFGHCEFVRIVRKTTVFNGVAFSSAHFLPSSLSHVSLTLPIPISDWRRKHMDIHIRSVGYAGSDRECDSLPGLEINQDDRSRHVLLLHHLLGTSHCAGTSFRSLHIREIAVSPADDLLKFWGEQ